MSKQYYQKTKEDIYAELVNEKSNTRKAKAENKELKERLLTPEKVEEIMGKIMNLDGIPLPMAIEEILMGYTDKE